MRTIRRDLPLEKAGREFKMNADKKAIWGWAMYDWANSAFATTVMAGFFPLFFKKYWSLGDGRQCEHGPAWDSAIPSPGSWWR